MWSSRLFWKLFLVTSGLNIALAIVFVSIFAVWQHANVRQKISDQLENTTVVLRNYVESTLREFGEKPLDADGYADVMHRLELMDQETELRFTVISKDGEVLADSRELPERMENHRERPELLEALKQGVGIDERVERHAGRADAVRRAARLSQRFRRRVGAGSGRPQADGTRRGRHYAVSAAAGLLRGGRGSGPHVRHGRPNYSAVVQFDGCRPTPGEQ